MLLTCGKSMVQSTERLSVLLNKLLMNTASGEPFALIANDTIFSSTANSSFYVGSNPLSWQPNDVLVAIVGGRIQNSTTWNVANSTLDLSGTSFSLVASYRTTNAYSPFAQVFYRVATTTNSGTGTFTWSDNTAGNPANLFGELYVLRGSGAPSSYEAFATETSTGSSVTLGTGACAIAGAFAFNSETGLPYIGGNPIVTVSYYALDNHDGKQYFDDTPPSTIEIGNLSASGVYGGIVINP